LDELQKKVNAASPPFLIEGAAAVRKEVHLDTLSRLDQFTTLADRAERDAKEGRRPAQSPEELLSSAITGWHLGKVAAEPRVGTAYKCWATRQMALQYLRTPNKGQREKLLKNSLESETPLSYAALEKRVSPLPPPDAPDVPPPGPARVQPPPTADQPLGVDFILRLP